MQFGIFDHLDATGWSYGVTTYRDEDGRMWTQIDARREDEVKVWWWERRGKDDEQ